jgi:hypothetical protein
MIILPIKCNKNHFADFLTLNKNNLSIIIKTIAVKIYFVIIGENNNS